MSITIRNDYLEQRIDREAEFRGHKTRTQTLEELASERLTQLEIERRQEQQATVADPAEAGH